MPCLERECILLAASILSSVDKSKDPCDSFYDYANNGWLVDHPLPVEKDSFSNFEALYQKNTQLLQRVLQTDPRTIADPADQGMLRKLNNHYSACLDEQHLNDVGEKPLRQFVRKLKQLFREEDTDISTSGGAQATFRFRGLTAALAFLHSRGVPGLFSFDIDGDVGVDSSSMTLWFSQSSLGLPSKEYYGDKTIRRTYKRVLEQLLSRVADVLGMDSEDEQEAVPSSTTTSVEEGDSTIWPPWPWPPWEGDEPDDDEPTKENRTERLKKLVKRVVKFERRLAKASLDLDVLYQDPFATYNPVAISNFTDTLSMIDFPTYFSTFTPRAYPEKVIVTHPQYAEALADLLKDTDSAVIEAYLISRAMLQLSPYLGTDTPAWKAQRALYEALSGIKKGAVGDRAEFCVKKVDESFGFATGRFFVNQAFDGDSKSKARRVVENVVTAFKKSLTRLDWMDKKSATAAAEKAGAIRIKVGYPVYPDTMNPRAIAQYYGSITIDKDTFFENTLGARSNAIFRKWLQLGKKRNPEVWDDMFPSTVNAEFSPPANEMLFPAGILQPPFFEHTWPGYITYGAFGSVAAHELTHAFDSAGRLYNQEGRLEHWWTDKTSKAFNVKQKCIVDQFSSYTIDDGKGGKLHVNGNLTSGENIGDSGLIQAYRAWKNQFNDGVANGTEFLLPGLPYTREQLFFISFARIWARTMKDAAAVRRIRTDPHSPTRYRVDGTLSNIPEFAAAFSCPKGSKLNPPRKERCIFWG